MYLLHQLKANPFVEIHYSNITILSHLMGFITRVIYMAITIGKYFEVEDLSIKEALESYIPENNRSQLLTKGSNDILDAYNANPRYDGSH
jgi:UDP-N-acetylmuramoyl-tripeptide--D-alanyl-D-alanine ligase